MLLDDLSQSLGLDKQYLRRLARSASYRYKEYKVPKRSGRGKRVIYHPARELKLIQRWLVDNAFSVLPVHEDVYSYQKGISIKSLALKLRRGRYLLRMDFKDFFPSITGVQVTRFLRREKKFKCSETDLKFIRQVVCKDGALTIGAPSSPILSNAILYDLDKTFSKISAESDVKYCRYADDLYFSSSKPDILGKIEKQIVDQVSRFRAVTLEINKRKTWHSSRKHRRAAVGLILTPTGGVSLGRARKRMIRALVHKYLEGQLNKKQENALRGHLSFAHSVEPRFITRLREKYGMEVIRELFR